MTLDSHLLKDFMSEYVRFGICIFYILYKKWIRNIFLTCLLPYSRIDTKVKVCRLLPCGAETTSQ